MSEAKHLTETQRRQLKQIVKSLLTLWDDSTIAEQSLGVELDTGSPSLQYLGSNLTHRDDADKLTDAELIEAFRLREYKPRSNDVRDTQPSPGSDPFGPICD